MTLSQIYNLTKKLGVSKQVKLLKSKYKPIKTPTIKESKAIKYSPSKPKEINLKLANLHKGDEIRPIRLSQQRAGLIKWKSVNKRRK